MKGLARHDGGEATMQRHATSSTAATSPRWISCGTSRPVVSAYGLNHRLIPIIPSG